jgi:hypothetical protein
MTDSPLPLEDEYRIAIPTSACSVLWEPAVGDYRWRLGRGGGAITLLPA